MAGILFNVSDRAMHSLTKTCHVCHFFWKACFVMSQDVQSRHIILTCTETTRSTGRNTTSNNTPLSSVRIFKSNHFLRRHLQLDHNVDHQCLSVVEALVTTLKSERVTYCDPGRVLPPKRPDTTVASAVG